MFVSDLSQSEIYKPLNLFDSWTKSVLQEQQHFFPQQSLLLPTATAAYWKAVETPCES